MSDDIISQPRKKASALEKGDVFDRLTIVSPAGRDKHGNPLYNVICTCGTEKVVNGADLVRGKIRSCGCLSLEMTKLRNTTHGLSKTKEYNLEWQRERRKKRGDEIRERDRNYYALNAEKDNARSHAYHRNNPDKIRANKREYRDANRGKVRALGSQRRATKRKAAPEWAKRETALKAQYLYKFAKAIESVSDYIFHIDHIVPLSGHKDRNQVVCGLHVWYNLQLLPSSDNCSKSYYTWPNMW